MKWPWEFIVKTKATDRSSNEEWLAPAHDEVQRTTVQRDRIERILKEARQAELLVIKSQRR